MPARQRFPTCEVFRKSSSAKTQATGSAAPRSHSGTAAHKLAATCSFYRRKNYRIRRHFSQISVGSDTKGLNDHPAIFLV